MSVSVRSSAAEESSVKSATSQAVSVVQNVLECGVATVCRCRGVFPESFFNRQTIGDDEGGGGGAEITKFDESELCGPEPLDDGSSKYAGGGGGGAGGSPPLSPLTPCVSGAAASQRSQRSRYRYQAPYAYGADPEEERMKAEVMLLLHWVRGGAVEALRQDMLSRVVLGICVREEEEKKKDRLLEAYAVSKVILITYEAGYGRVRRQKRPDLSKPSVTVSEGCASLRRFSYSGLELIVPEAPSRSTLCPLCAK